MSAINVFLMVATLPSRWIGSTRELGKWLAYIPMYETSWMLTNRINGLYI
jgi:hypothetical protein